MSSTAKKVACPFCAALEKYEIEKSGWHDKALALANKETLKEVEKVIFSGSDRSHAELFARCFPEYYVKHYERIEEENPEDKTFYKCLNRMSSDEEFKTLCCDRHIRVWKKYQ